MKTQAKKKEERITPKESIVAFSCKSKIGMKELIEKARKASKNGIFVLLLKENKGITDRVLPSYLNAWVRIKDKNSRAESIHIETMLFIAGTFNISKAIQKCVATDRNKFMAVSNDRTFAEEFILKNNMENVREVKLRFSYANFFPMLE